jgi:hypothetical protein
MVAHSQMSSFHKFNLFDTYDLPMKAKAWYADRDRRSDKTGDEPIEFHQNSEDNCSECSGFSPPLGHRKLHTVVDIKRIPLPFNFQPLHI